MKQWKATTLGVFGGLVVWLTALDGLRAGETNTDERLRLLQQQTDALQNQLLRQQEQIESLGREFSEIRPANARRGAAAEPWQDAPEPETDAAPDRFSLGNVRSTGEVRADFVPGITNLPRY